MTTVQDWTAVLASHFRLVAANHTLYYRGADLQLDQSVIVVETRLNQPCATEDDQSDLNHVNMTPLSHPHR